MGNVPLGLLCGMFGMLATVPGATMPDVPAMGHKLPATGTSADPPILTLGRFGAEHSDPGRLDGSADHRNISWVIHGHAQSIEMNCRAVSLAT